MEEAEPPGEEAIEEVPGTPAFRPPEGLLPLVELTRFRYAPSDRPRARLVHETLVIITASGAVEARDPSNGEFRWKLGFPDLNFFEPVSMGDDLLLASGSGKILLVDEAAGTILKDVDLSFELALAPLPGEEPGRFFLATTDAVVLYDWSAGPVFRAPIDEKPLALATRGTLLVVSGAERTLTALDARNGASVWRFIGRGGFHAAAVFRNDGKRLFIGDDAGDFYSLSTDKGEIDFRWSTGAAIRSSALVEGNRVYVASLGNNLYAYDADGGSEQWRARLPGRPATTPIRVNQRLLVTTLDGTLVEVETGLGHLGKSHALPGELLVPLSARIEPAPMTEQTFADTEPAEAETPYGETTPRWFERSRIAAVIRTGEVLLLRHQSETPPVPTPSTEDSTVPH